MAFTDLPRRWRLIVLVSLGVNLLVAGLTIGAILHHRGPDGPPGDRGPRALAPLIDALPGGDREAFRTGLVRPDRREEHARRRESFETLLTELRRAPFDRARVLELLSAQRRLGAARMAALEEVLVGRLAEMTAEERSAYADRLDAMVARRE